MAEQEELENKDLSEDLNSPQVHPLEPEKKFPIKWVLAGAVSVLILVALSGVYLLGKNQTSKTPSPSPTKQSDETANWKTYQSKSLSLSFKYPDNWFVDEVTDPNNKLIQISNYTPNKYGQEADAQIPVNKNDFSIYIYDSGIQGAYNAKAVIQTLESRKDSNGNYIWETFTHNYRTNKEESKISTFRVKEAKPITLNDYSALFWQTISLENGKEITDNPIVYVFDGKGNSIIAADGLGTNTELILKILSTFKFTNSTSAQTYLKIPELGVKIPLTDANKDAYYEIQPLNGEDIAELKVHSLDSEPYCNAGELSGIASLSKISKNDVGDGPIKFMIDAGNATLIGNYYYLIEGEQSVCSQKSSNMTIETNALKAFGSAAKNITVL